MVTPLDILEPGGTLIVASACSEGFGSAEFRASQARLVELGPDAFLQTLLAKRFADVDEWQTEMQLKPMRAGRVQLYTTGLDVDDLRLTGVANVDSVESAVAAALARAGDAAVAVIPEGPYVVPVVA
jgi:lactate racemase